MRCIHCAFVHPLLCLVLVPLLAKMLRWQPSLKGDQPAKGMYVCSRFKHMRHCAHLNKNQTIITWAGLVGVVPRSRSRLRAMMAAVQRCQVPAPATAAFRTISCSDSGQVTAQLPRIKAVNKCASC